MNAPSAQPITVAVVEDDVRARTQLCAAIGAEPGLVLAASFERLQPALEWVREHVVDVLLTDLGLPDGSGIALIRACAQRHSGTDIMVITMFGDEASVLASIEAGASGYLLKDSNPPQVGQAIRELRAGGAPMSPMIARRVLTRMRTKETLPAPARKRPVPGAPGVCLTRRESETLDLIARGYTYEEAARLMSVSVSTVQTYIRGIYGKLAVSSRTQAVFEAHKLGLLMEGLLRP
ncbi:MAG TPA: response regulator transcription factor [Noviherbaspirillum sp.]|nr:response regulator transcription factor [Noviherbaspirillum sp.]